ncbi:LuxR C-terminal-related transcriptional regulator [Rhizobium sp. L1K21]|uniref:helix-turn-helix transcriptional regulator n=1 Tax=Rhizobium sp. L1K21 TaxID=2954933 RepID=UPI0020924790|nr:LuxR C-terminal-related transcriptional regulator [Rhizobium sp. L1K21]MCO6184791.1 LuxR C-terminal-related transcriptional regulator [Rhizobium sp. L1K21]
MNMNNNAFRSDETGAPDELTRSEAKCLALVAEGASVDAISVELTLTPSEIEVLLFCAQQKLKADNLLQAVSIALSKGIISF